MRAEANPHDGPRLREAATQFRACVSPVIEMALRVSVTIGSTSMKIQPSEASQSEWCLDFVVAVRLSRRGVPAATVPVAHQSPDNLLGHKRGFSGSPSRTLALDSAHRPCGSVRIARRPVLRGLPCSFGTVREKQGPQMQLAREYHQSLLPEDL